MFSSVEVMVHTWFTFFSLLSEPFSSMVPPLGRNRSTVVSPVTMPMAVERVWALEGRMAATWPSTVISRETCWPADTWSVKFHALSSTGKVWPSRVMDVGALGLGDGF